MSQECIIGVSGGLAHSHHDSAAALFIDGRLTIAEEEERSTRIKHAPGLLPEKAIENILAYAGLSPHEISTVAFARSNIPAASDRIMEWMAFRFGIKPKIELVDHHRAHSASAYAFSSSSCNLTFTLDLSGDGRSGTVTVVDKNWAKEVAQFTRPHSVGVFYSLFTEYLGFKRNTDEYKIMALAALGRPCCELDHLISFQDGILAINETILSNRFTQSSSPHNQEPLFSQNLKTFLSIPPRIAGSPLLRDHFNLAASVQQTLEHVVSDMVKYFMNQYGIPNICFAGGIALNCKLNERIRQLSGVHSLFVPPWPSDAGTAIGAAVLTLGSGFKSPATIDSRLAFLGAEFNYDRIEKSLKCAGVSYKHHEDLPDVIASRLAEGKVVGLFQGRMEFGPRALGNRSILGDPERTELAARISREIKQREWFRPLAPAVLTEEKEELFNLKEEIPFMTRSVSCIRPELLPAAVHVDGSSRLQTVLGNTFLGDLLRAYKGIKGRGVLINTSFNVRGEPIVRTPEDALATFFSSGIDVLAMGPFLVTK